MVAAGSITVAVRVRPPTPSEAARLPEPSYDTSIRGDGTLATPGRAFQTSCVRDIVQVIDDRILTFDPPEQDASRAFVERGFMPPGSKRYKDKRFMFDRVFDHTAVQRDVYDSTAKPLLEPLLDGFNATIFAYGATGCGKTHTISGTDNDPGIIYMTMADLFQRIDDRRDEWNVEVIVTFLEIYNEEIRDLLAEPTEGSTPRGGLQIREDKSVKVTGLVELRPRTAEEVKQIVLQGNARRMQSPTLANMTSSRSHAVLQVHVTQTPHTAAVTEERTMGTLSIIDLAGSERAAATTNMGQRMVEGANINKSLLALGNCINALCESGGAIRHVPYRNSKLTRLLKFSLGGNCKTVMIVCIAPTSLHFDDTHNTLLYAERATKIKTKVVTRNVVNVDRHVGQYVEAITRLNLEVAELKAKLASRSSGEAEVTKRKRAEALVEVERARKDLAAKAEQTKPAVTDGATCSASLSLAQAKLKAILARLAQLDSLAAAGPLPADLQAERALLTSMAAPEEAATKPDSALNTRLNRCANAGHMFDAMLKAVSERRSDKLDEISVENVKLDARCRRAEMERFRAEARWDATQSAFASQSQTLVNLVGIVGRCTVMLGEASRMLAASVETGGEGMSDTVRAVAASLKAVANKNDEDFTSLLGHSTAGYTTSAAGPSSLNAFAARTTSFPKSSAPFPQSSAGPVAPSASQSAKPKFNRRSSSYGAAVPSPRKGQKSPRRSMRSSLVSNGAPYRRLSSLDKGKKKSVQWPDETGKGTLDDGGADPFVVSPAPAPPPVVTAPPPSRPPSAMGSESEWEDVRGESPVIPFPLPRDTSSTRVPFGGGRARPSRLDPMFLKAKGQSSLASLAEDDENGSPRRPAPLSDRNVNARASSLTGGMESSNESSSSTVGSTSALHVPKGAERHQASPMKRHPPLRVPGSATKSQMRRRSNVGPLKPRRRSSLIPQLSPTDQNGSAADAAGQSSFAGPRRVLLDGSKSPAKRPKRLSLLGALAKQQKLPPSAVFKAPAPLDPNVSAEFSFGGGSRPTWR